MHARALPIQCMNPDSPSLWTDLYEAEGHPPPWHGRQRPCVCRVVGHVALGRELDWSQGATLRVVWQALVAEARAPAAAGPRRTAAVMLQRLLYCHAQHRSAVPEAASAMVASLLVPQVHSLTSEQVCPPTTLLTRPPLAYHLAPHLAAPVHMPLACTPACGCLRAAYAVLTATPVVHGVDQ